MGSDDGQDTATAAALGVPRRLCLLLKVSLPPNPFQPLPSFSMDTDTSDSRSKATDLPAPIGFTDPDSLTKVCARTLFPRTRTR